jgi:hypothetical protein
MEVQNASKVSSFSMRRPRVTQDTYAKPQLANDVSSNRNWKFINTLRTASELEPRELGECLQTRRIILNTRRAVHLIATVVRGTRRQLDMSDVVPPRLPEERFL